MAALLSLVWPGLGQLYNRQFLKGLLLMFGLPLVGKVGLGYAFLGAYQALGDMRYLAMLALGVLIMAAAAALWVYAIVDAHRIAERHDRSSGLASTVTDGR